MKAEDCKHAFEYTWRKKKRKEIRCRGSNLTCILYKMKDREYWRQTCTGFQAYSPLELVAKRYKNEE